MTGSVHPAWISDGSAIPDPLRCGARAVEFLRRLRHPQSDAPRQAFQLFPWQERIVRHIYGPRHEDGRRIVQTVLLLLPRGNRKTSLAAALALLHLIGPERVPAGQVIFAAADREQAGIGFREAANIVRMDKRIEAATRIYDAHNAPKKIVYSAEDVTLRAISSDGSAQHGLTPSFILADELHVWRGRDLWEALRSGTAKVPNALTVIATTAGRGSDTVAADLFDYGRRVALGEITDPSFLPIIFAAEPEEDWRDEAVWHRVNPGLEHGFPSLEGLRNLAREAEHRPGDRYAFAQYNLNVWMANSRDPLFDLDTYAARAFEIDFEELEGLPCWLGVDLSLSGDLSAVVAAWRHTDGQITIAPWVFVPGEDLRARADRDGAPYEAWEAAGQIIVTPGPVVDHGAVETQITELCARFDVQEIAFDPHLARKMMQNLHDDGLPVVEFRQTPLNMGVAAGDLERTVNGRMIRHDGHPVLAVHFANVVASRNDNSGLIRMHKARKTDRIDAAIAAAMAVSRACAAETAVSAYNDPAHGGIFTF
ncbi:terminase large subunit [Roseivivax sp. THAF197b]|uniref:terminase large subunit n=1 Tax=Roseivivax sp. THAF197b TaxID=2588299 RepID=UPI001267BF5B|nr:terminase TerL endonuclease subunit [Roseivivax sp. THAF197b]QFS82347.1 Phage Terminase [Roseivivax sp. THAF197b]